MANKRQKKKLLKKQQQRYLEQRHVATRRLSNKEIQQLYHVEQEKAKKERQKQRKRERQKALKKEKFDYLVKQGFESDKIKASDLKKSWEHIKQMSPIVFDFEKTYTFKDNCRMFIAFRDYAGETNFKEMLLSLDKLSNAELLSRLKELARKALTYTGKGSTSGGKAGDYKMMIADQTVIDLFNRETYKENHKKPKRKLQHTIGDNKGYQILKSHGRVSFNEYTPRKMLELAVAIMDNVTEMDRTGFYSRFYGEMQYHNPDFAEILPEPLF